MPRFHVPMRHLHPLDLLKEPAQANPAGSPPWSYDEAAEYLLGDARELRGTELRRLLRATTQAPVRNGYDGFFGD